MQNLIITVQHKMIHSYAIWGFPWSAILLVLTIIIIWLWWYIMKYHPRTEEVEQEEINNLDDIGMGIVK